MVEWKRFSLRLAAVLLLVAFVSLPLITASDDDTIFYDSFDESFDGRWIVSEKEDYKGVWKHEKSEGHDDYGLLVSEKARKYAIVKELDKPVNLKDGTTVLQFETRLQNGLECGGAYIKYLRPQEAGWVAKEFDNESPYAIMFGPDKCGTTNKVHFILKHKNPKSGEYVEHHLKFPPAVPSDKLTHVYTAILKPDNELIILVDGEEKKKANFLSSDDFEPSLIPAKTIPDPDDKKPKDWDERAKIPDPDAVKPDDWDEDAPMEIEDEEAVKPEGWLDDEPEEVDDPEAAKPEDWDDEEDGEWEAPKIDNPKCETAPGCGEWKRPTKRNPAYKGKWHAPLIDNPSYKGIWKPQDIPNPDYFELEKPDFEPIAAIGIEIWTMQAEEEEGEDDETNEFLSRFVAIMRRKISEAYPDCDKPTVDNMLLVIVQKVVSEMEKGGVEHLLGASAAASSPDFSEDLWKTVWEVSNSVLEDMEKERKKEKMKKFLQCQEVTKMCRFAGEIGIRGDMLREMRFKWAAEKMEESEFYEKLERLRKEGTSEENDRAEEKSDDTTLQQGGLLEDKPKVAFLPKRHGKIRYKINGLDLSDPKWSEVSDKIHEAGEAVWPREPKNISGKCKLVNEKVLQLREEDDPSPLLTQWAELLQPNRIDWISLLEKLKERNYSVYLKVAELLLDEATFQPNVRDYSALIDALAKGNRLQDAERIIKKMTDNVVVPDMLTLTVLVQVYSKAGNCERADEAFKNLKNHGFIPDVKVYNSMISAYINAGDPKRGEQLVQEMHRKQIKPGREIYMALLKSFAKHRDSSGASQIASNMVFSGYEHDVESFTHLIEAYGQHDGPDEAKGEFDRMKSMGLKPDDNCVASMIRAYQKVNRLDDALDFLLGVEKDGFEPGLATYTVLVDWMGQLQLVDEAEHLLRKIADLGQAPLLQIQVSLCDMYSRARIEKKALQALGVLEANKEQLGAADFERIIYGLVAGGFGQEARRLQEVMKAQGFSESDTLLMTLMSSKATT